MITLQENLLEMTRICKSSPFSTASSCSILCSLNPQQGIQSSDHRKRRKDYARSKNIREQSSTSSGIGGRLPRVRLGSPSSPIRLLRSDSSVAIFSLIWSRLPWNCIAVSFTGLSTLSDLHGISVLSGEQTVRAVEFLGDARDGMGKTEWSVSFVKKAFGLYEGRREEVRSVGKRKGARAESLNLFLTVTFGALKCECRQNAVGSVDGQWLNDTWSIAFIYFKRCSK